MTLLGQARCDLQTQLAVASVEGLQAPDSRSQARQACRSGQPMRFGLFREDCQTRYRRSLRPTQITLTHKQGVRLRIHDAPGNIGMIERATVREMVSGRQ